MLKKILDWSGSEPFRSIVFQFLRDKYFDDYALGIWNQTIREVGRTNNFLSHRLIEHISDSRSLKRHYYKIVNSPKNFLDLKDFCLSIAIEFSDINADVEADIVIQLAKEMRRRILNNFKSNGLISYVLEKEFNINISDIKENSQIDSGFRDILNDRIELIENFYDSYNTGNDEDLAIKIFYKHPEKKIVTWEEEFSYKIRINAFKGFELGFFRLGYDYKIAGTKSNLSEVRYSERKKREAAKFFLQDRRDFGYRTIGKPAEERIWLR